MHSNKYHMEMFPLATQALHAMQTKIKLNNALQQVDVDRRYCNGQEMKVVMVQNNSRPLGIHSYYMYIHISCTKSLSVGKAPDL